MSSFANGSENFVDVNAIPLAAVDRVEVLTTGASAVYGADAVAGVVNFILRKDFEGLRLEASYGDSTRGTDEGRYDANLVYGWQGERAHALVVVDAFQRNALNDRDRAISAVEPRPSQQGIYPSINDWNFDHDDLVEAACPAAQRKVGSLGEYCEVNRNAYTATDPASRQLGAYAMFDAQTHRCRRVLRRAAAATQHREGRCRARAMGRRAIGLGNPGLPSELRQRLAAGGFDLAHLNGYGRFPDARTIEVTTDSWRLLNGLRGSVGAWNWETALGLARSRSQQEAVAGIYNVERFCAATQGQLCSDGRITCAPGAGGLWYDLLAGRRAIRSRCSTCCASRCRATACRPCSRSTRSSTARWAASAIATSPGRSARKRGTRRSPTTPRRSPPPTRSRATCRCTASAPLRSAPRAASGPRTRKPTCHCSPRSTCAWPAVTTTTAISAATSIRP